MCGGRSYLPLDDILPPPAKDMICHVREVSENDAETWHPYPRSFLTVKTGFQKFKRKLPRGTIRQQQYLEGIRNCALDLFADYNPSVDAVEDVDWLSEHDHIVKSPTVDS